MFGIGKAIQQVLEQHNLGDTIGRVSTESMADLRQSLEALNREGAIGNLGQLLDDLSSQLQDSFGHAAQEAGHLADEGESPREAVVLPHETAHLVQGVSVEADGVIAAEAEDHPAPAMAEPAHADDGDDGTYD